ELHRAAIRSGQVDGEGVVDRRSRGVRGARRGERLQPRVLQVAFTGRSRGAVLAPRIRRADGRLAGAPDGGSSDPPSGAARTDRARLDRQNTNFTPNRACSGACQPLDCRKRGSATSAPLACEAAMTLAKFTRPA